ncbi:MAG: hypothetical protein ACT4NV_15350 [Rhodoferax sp.]
MTAMICPLPPAPVVSGKAQAGASLIELMVGITIGLLVVLAATSTIMVTRQGSTTVSDRYRLTAAGNNAMRNLANTLRQAGAMELLQVGGVGTEVSFSDVANRGAANGVNIVSGTEGGAGPDTLTVSFQHRVSRDAALVITDVTRDCLGDAPDPVAWGTSPERIDNIYQMNGVELRCNGRAGVAGTEISAPQALVGDNTRPTDEIAAMDFQVRYQVQNSLTGDTRLLTATDVPANGGWGAVNAVEVCLHLRGVQTNYPNANFNNCSGVSTANGGRLHQVFRNTFRLRSKF